MTDLFLLDIKIMDPEKHRQLTGWDGSNIQTWPGSCPIKERMCGSAMCWSPGYTDGEEDVKSLSQFAASLN